MKKMKGLEKAAEAMLDQIDKVKEIDANIIA